MKRFFSLVVLSIISVFVHAEVSIYNNLPFPIDFEYEWETGAIWDSCGGSKFRKCKRVTVNPNTKQVMGDDVGFIKKRYTVWNKNTGDVLVNQTAQDHGNRDLRVSLQVIDNTTGEARAVLGSNIY